MALERADAQSIESAGSLAQGIRGAHDFQLHNSSINVVGGDSHKHTHIHYHGAGDKLRAILDAIFNFRRIQQDTLAKATPGTIVWLLECEEFKLFIDIDGTLKIMWGSGMPGAGKTVLASIVINKLEALAKAWNGQICVAYVYIRYSDQDQITVRAVLEALVKQTVEHHTDCLPLLQELYEPHLRDGTQPTEKEILQLLAQFIQKKKATFYVLDALDEAPIKTRLRIIQTLSSLDVRLFITSRPLPALEAKLPDAFLFPILAQDQDLDLHIAEKISDSEDLQDLLERGDPSFKDHLISTVKAKCGGMFLHASLQLDALQDCFTVHDAMHILEAFPKRIEDVYRQTWNRITHSELYHASLAKAALVWVLNALHSLTMEQLQRALATCPETYHYDPARLMPGATILAACRGLITVDKESKLVRLVHYTAKEPLEGLLGDNLSHLHSLLARVCITRLADCGFQNAEMALQHGLREALKADSLLAYAYEAWVFHAHRSLDVDSTARAISTFVGACRSFPIILPYSFLGELDCGTGLHVAALYNFPIAFSGSCNADDVNVASSTRKMTPLQLACLKGHHAAAQSLLTLPDILVNLRGDWRYTPLMFASEEGHEDIVELLLAHPRIEVNLCDRVGDTALTLASGGGHYGTVKLLLAHPDIDVNKADHHNSSPLLLASQDGHTRIVALLLAVPDIDISLIDRDGDSAIKMAADHGREDTVRLLLAAPGIDTTVRSTRDGHTAMSAAVAKGHHGIVRLLEEFEASKEAYTSSRYSPSTVQRAGYIQRERSGSLDSLLSSYTSDSDESKGYEDAVEYF